MNSKQRRTMRRRIKRLDMIRARLRHNLQKAHEFKFDEINKGLPIGFQHYFTGLQSKTKVIP